MGCDGPIAKFDSAQWSPVPVRADAVCGYICIKIHIGSIFVHADGFSLMKCDAMHAVDASL